MLHDGCQRILGTLAHGEGYCIAQLRGHLLPCAVQLAELRGRGEGAPRHLLCRCRGVFAAVQA